MADNGHQVVELISRARAAVADARWLDALDLASQALAEDPTQTEAAVLVGTARQRLGSARVAGAELRQVTVLAVDMTGSTTIAAKVGPEQMRELMLAMYEVCAEAVARYDGRVTKYSGDGVLAQFGHPVAHEDDARRAVLAALALLESVRLRAADWEAKCGERIEVRIGIDSGIAAIGPVDTSPWSPEEIAGDPPNVATRVQSTAEPMTIRVTDATHRLVEGWIETAPVGVVELRNYPRPIRLHLVLGETEAQTRLEARAAPKPALINRERELAVLRGAWNSVVASGQRRTVGIIGEPGIGKSRLGEHMLATAVAAGATNVTLACSPLYRDSPLRPVARAVGRFFRMSRHSAGDEQLWLDAIGRQLEQLPGRRVPTDEAVPVLGWLLGIRPAENVEPDALRRRAFEVLIDLFEAMASSSVLVIFVEDVDTADPSTIELLEKLLERPPSPMLLIHTARTRGSPLPRADDELELPSLSTSHAAEIARSVEPELADEAIEQVARQSDGVPFFAEELARAARESGTPALTESVELSAFLAARLDELGPDLKRVLRPVAVAGNEINVDVLRGATELPDQALDHRLSELDRRRVVVRSTRPSGDVVRFRHGLMRTVAYESILEAQRRELHAELARLMVELPQGAVAPEDLAGHYEHAGDHGRAAPRWIAAGRLAAASGSHAEAAKLFERGLGALSQLPASSQQPELELEAQHALGAVLSSVQGYTSPAARAAFERAVELAERLEDAPALVLSLYGVWEYWVVLGEHRVATALAERCIQIGAAGLEEDEARLLASAISGHQRLYLGDFERARGELEVAGHYLHVPETAVMQHHAAVVSLAALPVAMWFLGETDASRATALEATAVSESLDPTGRRTPFTRAYVGCLLAWRAELDGDHDGSIAFAEEAMELATKHGYPTWLSAATLHRSIAVCGKGLYDEGLPILTMMVEAWRAAGRDPDGSQRYPVLMSPYFAGRLAEALLATGDLEQAATVLDRTLIESSGNGERLWGVQLLRLRAELARLRGAAPQVIEADLQEARQLAERQGARALLAQLAVAPAAATEVGP